MPLALEAQSLNHWTAREVPYHFLNLVKHLSIRERSGGMIHNIFRIKALHKAELTRVGFNAYKWGEITLRELTD